MGIDWKDITCPTVAELESISKEYNLNGHVVRDCLDPDLLPKFEEMDEANFLVLRFFHHTFNKRIATIQDLTNKIAIFYTDHYLITIHKAEVNFLKNIRKKYVVTGKCGSPIEVVTKIIWYSLETFENPAQRLSERIDFFESYIFLKGISKDQIETLYYMKQQASMCNKILTLMLEPINNIPATKKNRPALQNVRDQHLKMQTLYIQALEDVNNLMNLYLSFSAQKTNEVVKVLTIFSVFFMPLTFIAGIYGMNFQFMPELNEKWGYPAVLFSMLVVTVVIFLWFKRKKWM